MMPMGTGSIGLSDSDRVLTAPYAISYDIAAGASLEELTKGAYGSQKMDGAKFDLTRANISTLFYIWNVILILLKLANRCMYSWYIRC